jgi:hypothetical protein
MALVFGWGCFEMETGIIVLASILSVLAIVALSAMTAMLCFMVFDIARDIMRGLP